MCSAATTAVAMSIKNKDTRFAYSCKFHYDKNPLDIYTSIWRGPHGFLKETNRTCVLFTKDKVFHSFGYESKIKYTDLVKDEMHREWYFFERFLSFLDVQEKPLSKSTYVQAVDGKELPAICVISEIFKSIKDHFLETLRRISVEVDYRDIQWVLSVPTIWNDPVILIMKEAAKQAGINDDQLLVVSEEEAAVLLCKHLLMERVTSKDGVHDVNSFPVGNKYIVLNCEAEAAFLTVFKVNADFSLKDLYQSRETSGGVSQVYKAYEQLLTEIVGAPIMKEFSRSYPEDYAMIQAEFKEKRYSIRCGENQKITIAVPYSLVEVFEEETGEDIQKSIDNSKYHSKIKLSGNRFRFSGELVTDLFIDPSKEIIALVNTALKIPGIKGTKNIIMIGEFAEFRILKDIIEQALPEMEVFVDRDAKLTGLKGAVIYGHEHGNKPKHISSRVAKFIATFKKKAVLRV